MQLFVNFEVFHSILSAAEVATVRQRVGAAIQRIQKSGKMKAGGFFLRRGGVLILDVNSAEEALDLLGAELIDSCAIETHLLMSFDKLGEFFAKHPLT